ncbi:hypothetical protein BDV38DRAFT_238190 [Aspergillus pseudotamarii]|uniref:Uncharacterized protein n=1 Tax=Aspergillus pseudotamarii TaxID=132259 RepID=A0A5N6T408_ASPPS|nr:uncharacterized protein BDV38DRAFT_238190 [Aspergillus pseudotamarii]KAE8140941.1 hypothetical protein BDV38DRAFT_238190 [Aspergillus pseudotamarii]
MNGSKSHQAIFIINTPFLYLLSYLPFSVFASAQHHLLLLTAWAPLLTAIDHVHISAIDIAGCSANRSGVLNCRASGMTQEVPRAPVR